MKAFVIETNKCVLGEQSKILSDEKTVTGNSSFAGMTKLAQSMSKPDWLYLCRSDEFLKSVENNDILSCEKHAKKMLVKLTH